MLIKIENNRGGNGSGGGAGLAHTVLDTWISGAGEYAGFFYADFAHGLDTTTLLFNTFDNTTNEAVIVHALLILDANTVRVYIDNNTDAIKLVIGGGEGSGGGGGLTPTQINQIIAINNATQIIQVVAEGYNFRTVITNQKLFAVIKFPFANQGVTVQYLPANLYRFFRINRFSLANVQRTAVAPFQHALHFNKLHRDANGETMGILFNEEGQVQSWSDYSAGTTSLLNYVYPTFTDVYPEVQSTGLNVEYEVVQGDTDYNISRELIIEGTLYRKL